jgi:hypothetical protein
MKRLLLNLALPAIIAFALSTAAQAVPNNTMFLWDENPPEENVLGYVLAWGNSPGGPYTISLDVGPTNMRAVFLLPGVYYAVVKAYNAEFPDGGPWSDEVRFVVEENYYNPSTPTLVIVKPNGIIAGGIKFVFNVPTGQCLIIEKSIDLLNWEPVSTSEGPYPSGEVRMILPKKKQEFFRWTLVPCDVAEDHPN